MKIILLGSQGSGKSTQAKLLSEKLEIPYIEMGQLLRDRAKGNNSESGQIRLALDAGNLVSDQIVVKILQERISKKDCQENYVLDGFPRNYAQLEGLPKDINKVIYLKVSDQEAINRLIGRGRDDDTLDLITRRLELYHTETKPLLTYFSQQGILVEIDGMHSIDETQKDLLSKVLNLK